MPSFRDMNFGYSPETRRKPIHGGSSPASMRVEVSGEHPKFILEEVNGTAMMKDIKIKHLLFEFASLGILMLLIPYIILVDVTMKTHWVGEISLTEFSQEIFLLIAIVIFCVAAFNQCQARGLFILIAGLFSMMFIREGDHFLDYIYKGFWRVPVILVLLSTLYFSYKNKNSILKPLQIHIKTRAFTYGHLY